MGSPRKMDAVKWTEFLLYVLEPRRARGGWIRAADLINDLGLTRATAYRYIDRAELAGLPIQRDMERSRGMQGAGFRCQLQTTRRPDDTAPIDSRRTPKRGLGRKRRAAP